METFRTADHQLRGRFDIAKTIKTESQFSPRINIVYTPWAATTFHAGYARYFTPPPLENVPQSTIAKFTGTTNDAITLDSPVKAERAHYFDAGVTQKIGDGLQLGIDGFYKHARNVLDEGQFGQALILSSFNYREGEIYGGELTANYQHGGFSSYLNISSEYARGRHISSAQFLFDPDEFAYIRHHWVFLDHINVSPGRAEWRTLGTIGPFPPTRSTEMDCDAASPTLKRIILTKH